jgi:predicted short-subunit dehydrogenase-like oxidoreductase (DUF2520 family)
MSELPRIGIAGAGRAARALARALVTAGYPITGVYNRTPHRALALAQSAGTHTASLEAVAATSDIVFIAVSDDALSTLIRDLKLHRSGTIFVHLSGVHSHEVLAPLAAQGAPTASAHPIKAFGGHEADDLGGIWWGLEASDAATFSVLSEVVERLGGHVLRVNSEQKGLYHAALVMASNYFVTLYYVAEQMLISSGVRKSDADHLLQRLMETTLRNIQVSGPVEALTGPLVRGDTNTLETHLKALRGSDAHALYLQLAHHTLPLAVERGTSVDKIIRLLHLEEDHAVDNT